VAFEVTLNDLLWYFVEVLLICGVLWLVGFAFVVILWWKTRD
jgi:hypothetical protein